VNQPASPFSIVGDTDVVSFLFNRDPVRDPRYAPHLQGRILVLPFVVVGEMLYGAEQRNWGAARRLELERFIRRYQIEYPNYPLCEIWAELRATARRRGRPIERQDAWVAATAVYLDVPVVTHDAGDYAGVPRLQVITEPDPSP
jgi:predicted nucleic acid-binding protein